MLVGVRKFILFALWPLFMTLSSGCQSSSSDDEGIYFAKVGGIAAVQTGDEGTLNGWYALLLESSTSIGKVAKIDKTGVYKFTHVTSKGPFNLFILSPEMQLSSLVAGPGSETKKLRTTFMIETASLPKVIVKGLTSQFATTDGVSFQDQQIKDEDEDGIADGMKTLGLLDDVDTDSDGTLNSTDNDIDGDGLPNVFDPDDDGDGTIDVLDTDANGDGIEDSKQTAGDAYFPQEITYFSSLYTVVNESDTVDTATLTLKAKLGSGVSPSSVSLLAPDSYSTQSKVGGAAWDGTLLDDGKSNDGDSGDGIYGRVLTLADTSVVRPSQVIFLQLNFGTGDDKWSEEFPFMFPPISIQTLGVKYDRSTRTLTADGTPFGSQKSYTWSVTVYNSSGIAVFNSDAIKGSVTDYVIPERVLEANKSYTADISAQLLDRIPGNPSCASRSRKIDLQ